MKAMILAAGRGERMRPLTDHTPKPLLLAGGKPLVVWHLERLAQAGFSEVVINLAHLGEQIESALGSGEAWGLQIRYSHEPAGALETAGGIATAQPWGKTRAPFLLINGDVFSDWDVSEARKMAQASDNTLGHLVLVPSPAHHPQGDFGLQPDGQVCPRDAAATRLTYSGMAVLWPALFDHTPAHARAPLAPLLHEAMAQGRLRGSLHAGQWMDVGTPERLAALDHTLARGRPSHS
ncbi:MAG: nucleotidyl transferase [Pseudomonadota bacterium]|jgi:MurNAc alpha-1-phosphate uridylyltransferase